MPFTPKAWKNDEAGHTKIDAAALIDLEQRLAGYVDAADSSLATADATEQERAESAESTKQPLDPDLTAISTIEPKDGDILICSSGTWAPLAVGSPGQHLVVRSDGTVRWTTPAAILASAWGVKADGVTNDSTALQEAFNEGVAKGLPVRLPSGEIITNKELTWKSSYIAIEGAGSKKTKIVTEKSTYHALSVGPGNEGQDNRLGGFLRDFTIAGGNAERLKAGVEPVTEKSALKLNGARLLQVSDIEIEGTHDIGVSLTNNCYGSSFTNLRCELDACRVGVYMAKGSENGEDIDFNNCWISGEVAALHITSGKNYRVRGGQLTASRQAAAEEDLRGVVILGKDYLGAAGAEDTEITLETSFEGFKRCWAIRAFKLVKITAHSTFNANAASAAIGFYKNAAHGASYVTLDGCGFVGTFSKASTEMVIREGSTSGSTWHERGSWGSYKDGTGETSALFNNMARRAEVSRAQGTRDGNIFYMQGMEFKVTGGILEVSELHKESWRAVTGRLEEIAASNTLAPKATATLVKVKENTEIKKITATFASHRIVLLFSGTPTVKDGENLKLAGDLVATVDDTLELICDGTNWYEICRSVN